MLLALSALIFLLQARLWGEIEDYPLGPGVDSDDVSILGTGGRYNIMSHWGVVALQERGEVGASRRGVVALQQRRTAFLQQQTVYPEVALLTCVSG